MGAAQAVEQVEPNPLDTFRARSDRFLFAQPISGDGDLVYLRQGTAHARRAETRQSLRCPEPDCSSPEITTVSRSASGARDGYRHLVRPGTPHAPESAHHRQAKALVARWARAQPGVVSAEEEVRVGNGARVADVLLTSSSGNRLAIEIQYATLSIEDWLTRTESYRRLGVEVTWMWGHIGAHSPLQARWRAIGDCLARATRPVLWINPAEEQVAWAYDLRSLEVQLRDPDPPQYTFGRLDDLEIRKSGLLPTGFLDAVRQGHERAREREEQAAREREKRAERADAARRRRAVTIASGLYVVAASRAAANSGAAGSTCRRCGGRLDPALWSSGVHADPYCDR